MHKLLLYFLFMGLLFGCKKEVTSESNENAEAKYISFQNTSENVTFNQEADSILNAWPEYQALQNSFDVMYRAANNEDLVLAIDDLLEKEKVLRESKYPLVFDNVQIKSRQKVVRTFLLKIKASLKEQTNIEEPIKQMLTAKNAYHNQFNIITSSKLDAKLILNEN